MSIHHVGQRFVSGIAISFPANLGVTEQMTP